MRISDWSSDVCSSDLILADLVEGAAAAGASIALDVNDLFDPLEMRGQRTAVGLAHRITARPSGLRFAGGLGFRERRLGILKAQLQLILIELLGDRKSTRLNSSH